MMKPSRSSHTAIVAAGILVVLGGCAIPPTKLADPLEANSAMAVLSVTVRVKRFVYISEHAATEVVIGRLNPSGTVGEELRPSNRYKNYMFFENLLSGQYKLLRASFAETSQSGPAPWQGPGMTIGITLQSAIRFDPQLVEESRIDIPAGTVAYMGDYTANLNARMSFPLPVFDFESAAGGRTAEGRSRAQEMINTTYPDSPWLKRPIN